MESNKNKLLHKYLEGTATKKQTRQVLEWLSTDEGKYYFENHFQNDLCNLSGLSKSPADERELWRRIERSAVIQQTASRRYRKPAKAFATFAIAATLLLAFSATIFLQQWSAETRETADELTGYLEYQTASGEQQKLTLSDGTSIHLNENTTLKIPDTYAANGVRRVELLGEAHFDVEPSELVFEILAEDLLVQVLGTSFSVNNTYSDKTVVAVQSGLVSVGMRDSTRADSLLITEHMIGVYNKETSEILSKSINTNNYFYWIHGRILFDGIYFEDVLAQLNHMYGLQHEVQNEELSNMRLTAEITDRSAERVLETIAYTLGIEVEVSGSVARWKKAEDIPGS